MVNPRLPMAVEVEDRSVRLLEATSKAKVRSVDVPESSLMEEPLMTTVPVRSVVVPETCLMSMVPTVMIPFKKVRPPAMTVPVSPSISKVEEDPAESMVNVVEAISMVEEEVGSAIWSRAV